MRDRARVSTFRVWAGIAADLIAAAFHGGEQRPAAAPVVTETGAHLTECQAIWNHGTAAVRAGRRNPSPPEES